MSWYILLRNFLLVLLLCLASPGAMAAVFEVQGESASRHGYSQTVKLIGPLETGDVSRLEEAISTLPSGTRATSVQVSLDSPGGEFEPALALARQIAQKGYGTIVEADAVCLSGCAIAFMAGRSYGEDDWRPRRILTPGGTLGFHAPFVFDVEDDGIAPEVARLLLPNAERAAALAAAEMVQLSLDGVLPVSLVRELLTIESSSFLYIETIDQVGRWKIDLAGTEVMKAPANIEPDVLRQAADRFCVNYILWRFDIPFAERDATHFYGELGDLSLQTRCATELRDQAYYFVFQNYETNEQDQGPVFHWQTLSPSRKLVGLTYEDINGLYNFRTPFDPRDEPPSQIDGSCLQGFQWIGGWSAFAWQDAQAHATFRSCDGRAAPFRMTCDHGAKTIGFVVDGKYLPNGITGEVMKIRVDDQVFPAALGKMENLHGRTIYTASYGRNHPLFSAMRSGRLITLEIAGFDLTLHLDDADIAIDNFEASCL